MSLVSRIENGKARPSVASLYALVQHLNLTGDELVDPAGARAEARRATPRQATADPWPASSRRRRS